MDNAETPRYLAGAGYADPALEVLRKAGWAIDQEEDGNTFAYSPDGGVVAAWLPEGNSSFAPDANGWDKGAPIWVIRAYRDDEQAWEATFTVDTPTEFVAAMLASLVRPEPLERDW